MANRRRSNPPRNQKIEPPSVSQGGVGSFSESLSHDTGQYHRANQEIADMRQQFTISNPEKLTSDKVEPLTPQIPGLSADDDDHEMTAAIAEAISAGDVCAELQVDRFIQNAKAQFKIGLKRKAEEDEHSGEVDDIEGSQAGDDKRGPRPKRKRKSQGPKTPKNALMQLNEIRPGLVFETVSQTGPVHSPVFTVKVNVNGTDFEGSGTSKKRAKLQAAERALTSFVQFNNPSEAHLAMGRNVVQSDFTRDADELADAIMIDFAGNQSGTHLPNANGSATPGQKRTKELPQPKNPLMILNELKPGIKYDFVSETGDGINKCFVMSVTVDGKTFEGCGRNKKLAKNRAAQNALQDVYNMDFSLISAGHDGKEQLPKTLADHMMKLVFDKFTELTDASGSNYARRKVLAGFIVSEGLERENARVVSLATGTKCINGEYISDQGLALNDCHAEIIARRSFKRYLYGQLTMLLGPEREQSIFEAKPTAGYKLKENVQVHLYISTSPCGDARIFSPHETPPDGTESDKHPNRKARGQLRTKIESGEGTIPVKSSSPIQTWDGVLQGERLLTMSCSDKVCKWNAVGLQGSLLSHFIDPVYLNGIILGSLFHVDHMSRAMYGRVSPTQALPEPFRVNKPYLSGISHPESRQPGKAPSFSINWTLGDQKLEIINCTTGKDEQDQPSQVCKQALFRLFRDVYGKLRATTPPVSNDQLCVYGEMKSMVHGYQTVKEMLYKMFHDAGFGIWVGKPIEQDLFSISH